MLKKPSELYPRNEDDLSSVQRSLNNSPQLKSFKDNIQKINSLSDFSETLDTYRQSVDNVNFLSKEVESIRTDIKELLTTEDLDRAMMSQFVLIDQTISDVQEKVKSINDSKLKDIRENVESLTNSVEHFIDEDIPKYKKLFFDGEVRRDNRYEKFESSINESFKNSIKEVESNVEKIYDDVTSIVEGVNDKSLSNILEDVKDLGEQQEARYKKVILEGKIDTDKKYQKFEENVNDRCNDLTSIISTLTEKISLVEGDNSDIVNTLHNKAKDISSVRKSLNEIKKSFSEQTEQLEEYRKEIAEEVESLRGDFGNLKEDVVEYDEYRNQVTQEVDTLRESIVEQQSSNEEHQKELVGYKKNLDEELKKIADKVAEQQSSNEVLKERLEHKVGVVEEYKQEIDESIKTQEFYVDEHRKDLDIKFKNQESFVENYKKEIEQKVTNLYADIISNESAVKVQNSNIEQIKESVQSAIAKLNYDEIEKQNHQLANKIKYLEEVFEKFSEKELLTESVASVPPSETNLNENFVTVEYLQNHYRTFVNRIQQQLSSLGGGGEVRLEFLDDVDRTTAKVDGKFLKYDASSGKFVGADGGSGGGVSGVTTATVRDAIQGYYGYTTDFYTVGVANTTQEIGAGVTTMIEPKVASDGINQYLPTIMTDVGTNPFIGNTATTIGTGQTQFSLAGLSSGASCIVRTALAFDPDIDNTNLDVQLKFTTNTATQGTGLTNFTIKKEQAIIMNEGADQQYISENIFSFFVGTTLEGTTYSDAGSFNIEVIPSDEGVLEVLAVTVNVVA